MLRFEGVDIKVGGHSLVRAESEFLKSGIIALVGRNGSGKSTFIRTLLGMHQEYSGKIFFNDELIKDIPKKQLAKSIAIVFSQSSVFGDVSVRDILSMGRLPYLNNFAALKEEDHKIIQRVAEQLALISLFDKSLNQLSDGQRQMVMIGRALVQNTPILLLDEPGAFLDVVNKHKVMNVLKKIATAEEKLILFSTHTFTFLDKVCERVLLIDNTELKELDADTGFEKQVLTYFGITEEDGI